MQFELATQRLWVALHRVGVRALSLQQQKRRRRNQLLPMPSTTAGKVFLLFPGPSPSVLRWLLGWVQLLTSRRCPFRGSPFCYTTVLYPTVYFPRCRTGKLRLCSPENRERYGKLRCYFGHSGLPAKGNKTNQRMCISAKLPSVLNIESERALFKKARNSFRFLKFGSNS